MKKIMIFSCLILSCLFSGCGTINTVDEETYNSLFTYRKKVGQQFNEYIKNDDTLSSRDKNTFKTYERLCDIALSKLNVE